MDRDKLNWTKLQKKILSFLFENVGEKFTQREISRQVNSSPTAIGKALTQLIEERLVKKSEDKNLTYPLIELNLENEFVFKLKRVENLRTIYLSGLLGFLEDNFPGKTIVLFGSYSKGEDVFDSDIDIAILETKEKELNLKKFEKILRKEVRIQFYPDLRNVHKNLKENLFNGIVLVGGFSL